MTIHLFFRNDIIDMEKGGSLSSDVDERRFHPGKDFHNPAFINVANDTLFPFSFVLKLGQHPIFHQGDPGFVMAVIDDDFLRHNDFIWRVTLHYRSIHASHGLPGAIHQKLLG